MNIVLLHTLVLKPLNTALVCLKAVTITTVALLFLSACAATGEKAHNPINDYRTFHFDGETQIGKIGDSYTADLVIYGSEDQYMLMEALIKEFQEQHPHIKSIYVETASSDLILKAHILKQGRVNGILTATNPDLYATLNLENLKQLHAKNVMMEYMIYAHNKLALMIAQDNPKQIASFKDLGRNDLVHSHPNPLTEEIFREYGSHLFKQLGLFRKLTNYSKCKQCWAIKGKTWFTRRHQQETPQRIEAGLADIGLTWSTEIIDAKNRGYKIEGIAIPNRYNQRHKINYMLGMLTSGRNPENAQDFMSYLQTDEAQKILTQYGFIKATPAERVLKKI